MRSPTRSAPSTATANGKSRKRFRELGSKPEITRFKGLGVSPDEFGEFIGENIRLEAVEIPSGMRIKDVLGYYMGKNTPERRDFITSNLILEPVDPAEN